MYYVIYLSCKAQDSDSESSLILQHATPQRESQRQAACRSQPRGCIQSHPTTPVDGALYGGHPGLGAPRCRTRLSPRRQGQGNCPCLFLPSCSAHHPLSRASHVFSYVCLRSEKRAPSYSAVACASSTLAGSSPTGRNSRPGLAHSKSASSSAPRQEPKTKPIRRYCPTCRPAPQQPRRPCHGCIAPWAPNFPTVRKRARLNTRYAPANAPFPFLPRYHLTTPFPHFSFISILHNRTPGGAN